MHMRNTKGFTLIELLIVVVIIGILAAIAIPKFGSTKEKAYIASMKADLRNLVTAEESYFADNVTYTSTIANLAYSQSAGNTVTIGAATGTGWSATAKNNATTKTCGIFVGSATPPITGQTEGAPVCQ
jgi:prepilin-type N-terminal cleavage/methylation domain-containing protein